MDQATNAKGVVGSSFTKQHQDAHRSSSSMSNRSNFDVSIYFTFFRQNTRHVVEMFTTMIYSFTRAELNLILFTDIHAG